MIPETVFQIDDPPVGTFSDSLHEEGPIVNMLFLDLLELIHLGKIHLGRSYS